MDETTAAILKASAEVLLGIGGLSGLAAVLVSKRKSDAEARKTTVETNSEIPAKSANSLINSSGELIDQYKKLLDDYQKLNDQKIEDMNCEIDDLKRRYLKRISYLLSGIQMLTEQIINLGHEPCWTPVKSDLDIGEKG